MENNQALMWGKPTEYPFEFMGFTVYEEYQICKTCNQQVGRGMIPAARHYGDCEGKGTVESLKALMKEEEGKVTIDDLNKIFQS